MSESSSSGLSGGLGKAVSRAFLLEATRWFLRLFIALAVLVYIVCGQAISGTNWYQYSPEWVITGVGMIGKFPYHAAAVVVDGVVVVPGQDYFLPNELLQILWSIGPVVTAAMAALMLQVLPKNRHKRQNGVLGRLFIMGKRLAFFELPPRRLLLWCCGGVTVLDALLVGAWVGLQILWIQQFVANTFPQSRSQAGPTGEPLYQYYWENVAHALGWTGVVNLSLSFLPVPRNNFLHYIFNTDWSRIIKYHRWLGYGTMLMVLSHGGAYYVLWIKQGKLLQNACSWAPDSSKETNYLAGSVAAGGGLIIMLTSWPWLRRNYYQVFYFAHIVGFVIFTIFASIHYWQRWYFTAAGIILLFLDWTFRLAQQLHPSFVEGDVQANDAADILTLTFDWHKDTKLEPGQYMLVCMPTLARWKWQPVSVAGTITRVGQLQATTHMKVTGSWTKELKQHLLSKGRVVMRVEGPYGNPHGLCWHRHEAILIVAGGIGVTPMLAMLREMVRCEADAKATKAAPVLLPKVELIWACRTRAEFSLLDTQLLTVSREERGWLSIHLYLTGQDSGEAQVNAKNRLSPPINAVDMPSRMISPFFLRPGPLHPYHIGTWEISAATALACVGASYFLLTTKAIGIYFSYNDGFIQMGLLTSMALIVGAMGLPALLVFPLQILRRAMGESRAWQGNTKPGDVEVPDSLLKESVLSSRPSWISNPIADTCQSWADEGSYSAFSTGRPAVAELVCHFAEANSNLPEVAVFAAGPDSLNNAARLACSSWNDKFNLPFLDFSAAAFPT